MTTVAGTRQEALGKDIQSFAPEIALAEDTADHLRLTDMQQCPCFLSDSTTLERRKVWHFDR
jgi:hypothetical protein